MRPKIRRMNWFVRLITFDYVTSVAIAPFGIYIDEEHINDPILINHESIHWIQQMEMYMIPGYIWYFAEWLLRIPINKVKAFNSISFEREAYDNESNLNYLSTRKPYAWRKYLKCKICE